MRKNYYPADEESFSEEELSAEPSFKKINFMTILLAVLKRPWIMFISLLIVMVPMIYYLSTIIPFYRSKGTVMISVRGGSILDELSLERQYNPYSYGKTVKYYTSILDSRAFKRVVANFTKEYRSQMGDDSTKRIISTVSYSKGALEDGFLSIYATSDNREFAYLLAEQALKIFKQRSIELEKQEAQGILDFIDDQLTQLNIKMEKAENDLQTFLSEKNLIVENIEIGVGKQLFDLEKQLSEAQANFEMIQINIDSYGSKINEILDQITATYSQQDERLMVELRNRLNEIREELDRPAAADLTSAEINARYDEMNRIRSQLVSAATKTQPNNLQGGEISRITLQKLEEELDEALLEREKYKNQTDFYRLQLNRFKREHPNLTGDILEFASLTRSKNVLKLTFDILLVKREEARIRVASEHGGIKVIDEPEIPRYPIQRNKTQKLVFAFLASLGLGLVLSIIIDRFDTTIKDENDIDHLNLPVFGTLPVMVADSHRGRLKPLLKLTKSDGNPGEKLLNGYSQKSPVAEAYRSLKTSIQFLAQDQSKKIFVITSPGSSEGKSLTTINLGISFAQGGQRTLVLDCDLRRPVQHRFFGLERKPGLSDHFFGEVELADIIQQTPVDNLSIITAGTSPPNPAEMVASRTMKEFLKEIRPQYDIIVIDTPPVMACVDPRVLAQLTDGMIIIAKVESTKTHDIAHAVNLSKRLKVDILGVILNQVEFRYGYTYYYAYRYYNPYSYYYGSYSYYYYASGDGDEAVKKKRVRRKSKSNLHK